MLPRVNVLGVGVHAVNMRSTISYLEAWIRDGVKGYACLAGVHGVMEAQRDPCVKSIFANALLVAPDGMLHRNPTQEGMERISGEVRTPKQERFMARYLSTLDTKLMIGVGAAFLFHTGAIKDSPRWMKRAGLQWFHRLMQEPRRLWRRYLMNNLPFVVFALLQSMGVKHYRLDTESKAPAAVQL